MRSCSIQERVQNLFIMVVVIDANKGIYIPQQFAKMYKDRQMTDEMRENFDILLKGPEEEEYWEAWEAVLTTFSITASDGRKMAFFQDQDVFCYDPVLESPSFF